MGKKPPTNNPEILLDFFTDVDLSQWKKLSDLAEEYNVKLYYHLESLRELHKDELHKALLNTKPNEIKKEDWWRYVDFKYSNEFLSAKGSIITGQRFNIGNDLKSRGYQPFPALYIAETEETAKSEKFGIPKVANALTPHELAQRKLSSFTAVRLKIELNNVFDLTKASNLASFTSIISKFDLTDELKELAQKLNIKPPYLVRKPSQLKDTFLENNWRYYPMQHELPSNSQLFARMLRDTEFEGVIYPSTKLGGKKCIAVFPENLNKSDSYIELQDPAPSSVKYTKLHSKNWKELSSL